MPHRARSAALRRPPELPPSALRFRTPPGDTSPIQQLSLTIAATSGGGGGGGGTGPGQVIILTPTSLTFNATQGSLAGSSSVQIVYGLAGSATFNAVPSVQWLSVTPSSGTIGSQTVSVGYNAAGLGQGIYNGTINVSTSTSLSQVAVTLNVSAVLTVAPRSLSYTYRFGDTSVPAPQTISVFSTPTGAGYSAASSAPWLSVPSGTSTAPGAIPVSIVTSALGVGTLNGQITITPAVGNPVVVPVTMNVLPKASPQLSVSPPLSTYPLTQSSLAASGQVTVSNIGGGTLQFTAQASSDTGTWLKLAGAGTGSATSSNAAVVAYNVDPSGLTPGIYAGRITVTDASGNQAVAGVALVLSQAAQSIQLSQSGITVNAVAGGTAVSTQSFAVLNTGGGTMNWSAAASTVSGGNWLSVSPASGSSPGGQAGTDASISVNPAGLAAGQYYGAVNVAAPTAVNGPESISVLLNVAAAGGGSSVTVSTGAVILSAPAGTGSLQSQQITLFNPGTSSLHYTATAFASNGGTWLTVSPASGSLAQGSISLAVQADLSNLAPGVQTGTVRVAFDDGTVDSIQVIAIATGGTVAAARSERPLAASACAGGQAGYLVTAFAQPLNFAALQASVAQLVRVLVVDDCGKPVSTGAAAQVSFVNASGKSDAPINLQNAGAGVWEGTWVPVNAGSAITLNVMATENGLASGSASLTASVAAAAANAAPQLTGVINAASAALATPGVVTPGEIISIYGVALTAGSSSQATALPLSTTLSNTQVLLGNIPLPLYYAGAGQINGLIPQSLNPNASYQLVIARGSTLSVPVAISVAQYDPAIFTMDYSGGGQGAVEIAGTAIVAAPLGSGSRPVQSGTEYLSIFGTGFSPVTGPNGEAPPADGAGAPLNLLYSTRATVTATLGGVHVPVVFAGLTPGEASLYQVNAQVPAGVPTGAAVPLVLTLSDLATGKQYVSNAVTVAIQ